MKWNQCLLSVFAAVALAGCGDSAVSSSTLSSGGASGSSLQGRLQVGGLPVANTEVQLRSEGQVLATATSDQFGSFLFETGPLDQSSEKLANGIGGSSLDMISTIDGARYSAVVSADTRYVSVTEISTMVHDYMESHPDVTFEQADAVVGLSLGCPAGELVSTLSDSSIFDPATFQLQAESHGGDSALFADVQAGLGSQGYDFSAPDPYQALRVEGQDPHQRVEAPQALAQSMAEQTAESDLAYGTTMGVAGDNLSSGFGWIVARLGTNTPDSTFGEVVASMTSRQQCLNLLATDLADGHDQFEAYYTENLDDIVPILDGYTTELASAVQSRAEALDTPFLLPQSVLSYLSNDVYRFDAYNFPDRFLNFLGQAPDKDTIRGYNINVMKALGRTNADPRLSFYDLRYNDLTEQLQNNLNYHLGGARIAMDMAANTAHSEFLQPLEQVNSLANAITDFRLYTESRVSKGMRTAQQLVPPKLDRDDIIALPPSFPASDPGTPTLLYRGVWTWVLDFDNANSRYNNPQDALRKYASRVAGHPWVGQWGLPSRDQMAELDRIAAAAGDGDAVRGLIRMGVYPPNVSGPVHLMYKEGRLYDNNKFSFYQGAGRYHSQDVWRLSQPGQPGEFTAIAIAQSGSTINPGTKAATTYPVAALFVRGSLSDGTPEQFRSLLATGTNVTPQIDVSLQNGQAKATATYQFPQNRECTLDVTDRVVWTSDTPRVVEVSNLPGPYFPSGSLLASRPGSATITASLLVDGSQAGKPEGFAAGSAQYSSELGAEVRNISITPRNVIVTSAGSPAAYFYCTDFSASTSPPGRPTHLVRDITNLGSLDWTLRDPNGQLVDPGRAKVSTAVNGQSGNGGQLFIYDSTLPTGTYTIEARLTGGGEFAPAGSVFTDQTKVRIQLGTPTL